MDPFLPNDDNAGEEETLAIGVPLLDELEVPLLEQQPEADVVVDRPVIGIATKPRKHEDLPEWIKDTKKSLFFRAFNMRFGYHGVSGMLALVATAWYLVFPSDPALLTAMFFGVSNSVFGLALLKQVPKDTHIIGSIWAAHHDAFDLAIKVVFYINVRCLESFLKPRLLYKFAVIAAWTQFFDLASGANVNPRRPNSWFIVYPFFAAAIFDLWRASWTDIPLKTEIMMTIQLYLLTCSFLYSASFRQKNPFYKKLMFWVSVGFMLVILYVFFVPEAQKSLQRDWFKAHHKCPWCELYDVLINRSRDL